MAFFLELMSMLSELSMILKDKQQNQPVQK